MQNRKRDTDVQNRLLDSVGEGKGGMFQENRWKKGKLIALLVGMQTSTATMENSVEIS